MSENTRKSFYIFLTMILGVLLFLMLQRAAFLVAFLLGANVGSVEAQALSVVTSAIAVSFGAWYGIWLGMMWYTAVYEDGTTRGIFHTLRNSRANRFADSSGWEIDDVVVARSGEGKDAEKLEFFEANTVKFGGSPISASISRGILTPKKVTAKKPVRKPRKTAARKNVA